jgi:hypothetical protein
VDTVRVQVLLGSEENEALCAEARRLGVSKSEVVRRALRELCEIETNPDDPLFSIIGMVKGPGPGDVSVRHDDYLYGDPHS